MRHIVQRFFLLVICCLAHVAVGGEPELSPRKVAAEISAALDTAEKIELFSLDALEGVGPSDHDATGTFHGYPILGSVLVSTEKDRATLVDSVTTSIARSPLRMVACFFPRHGIRADLPSEKVELLICFECATVYYLRAGESHRLNIDAKPEKLLNALLAKTSPAVKKGGETP